MNTLSIQKACKELGINPGPLDGLRGPMTKKAASTASVSLKQWVDEYEVKPRWLITAEKYIGEREIRGSEHHPLSEKMWSLIRAPFVDDETPWCAGFVGACLEHNGIVSTRSAAARSYAKWGYSLDKPALGCVVVFWRGKRNGWSGHVGFVVGKDDRGRLIVLGGNQGNAVSIRPFDNHRVIGFRWPKGEAMPTLLDPPIISSNLKSSTNEA